MEKSFVYALCQADGAHSFPHQPQLQTVDLAAALHWLVPDVQIHVVEFVLLEEVRGVGAVALLQQVLRTRRSWWSSKEKNDFLEKHHDVREIILQPQTVKPNRGVL